MTLEASSSGPALVPESCQSGSCRPATALRRDFRRRSRRGAKAQKSNRNRRARGSIVSSFDACVSVIRSTLRLPRERNCTCAGITRASWFASTELLISDHSKGSGSASASPALRQTVRRKVGGPIRPEDGSFKAAQIERISRRLASQGSGDQQRVGLLKEPGTLSTFAARRVAPHELGRFDVIGWREVWFREVQAASPVFCPDLSSR